MLKKKKKTFPEIPAHEIPEVLRNCVAPVSGVSGLARVPCALGTFTENLADEETAGTKGGTGGTRFEDTNFLFPKSRPCDWTCGLQGGDAAGCMILNSSQDTTEQPFLFIWPHVVQHL